MSAANHKPLFIITGETGSGKTTFLLGLIEKLRENGLSVAGFAALSDPEDGPSGSFNMLDLASGKILPLGSSWGLIYLRMH
jgi:nucleoside-triphosphatase THEP1